MKILLLLALAALAGQGRAEGLPDARDPVAGMGVNIHFTDPKPGELEMLSAAGFRWVRMDLTWKATEKNRGVYTFSAYDRLLAALDRFHLHALLILDYANPLYDGGLASHTEEGRAAFARWAAAAATHFRGRGVIWEIWNEPNGRWFWRPEPHAEDYAKLALAATKAIQDAVPGETVLGPALSNFAQVGYNMDFVEVAARHGIFNYWPALTVHPYIHPAGPEAYAPVYAAARKLLDRHAPPGKTLAVVCGESGYSTAWPGIDEATQGKYLARLFLYDMVAGVPLTIWYDWHDDGPSTTNAEHNFGTVHNGYDGAGATVYQPKPAYLAARTYSSQLAGLQFKDRLATRSNDYILRFEGEKAACIVAWTTARTPHEVTFPAPARQYEVTAFDGTKKESLADTSGEMTVRVEDGPQYLRPITTGPKVQ